MSVQKKKSFHIMHVSAFTAGNKAFVSC